MPTWNQDCSRSERGMLSKIAVLDWCKIFRQLQGMELYPRLGKNFDIKDFLHCRFGMMAWAILIISCAIKQHTTEGRVSKSLGVTSLLMLAYTSKFFFTESEYWSSAEMVKDRAGFFFTWTSLVWNPFVRILVNVYLVSHPVPLGTGVPTLHPILKTK
jgi:7-dehydrocholesterol reductase